MAKYVGKRVVPIHCGVWDQNKEYEMLSIVLDEENGDSYIARKVVPVGIMLTNSEYWILYSLFSQQVEITRAEFEERQEEIERDNAETLSQIRADNDATEQAILEDNDATELAVRESNAATEQTIAQNNADTLRQIQADNDETETAIRQNNETTAQAIAQNNLDTLRQVQEDNDATEQAIRADNDATEQAIKEDNAATKEHVEEVTDAALSAMNQAKQAVDATKTALTARMDTIAGQTTSDTEVLDARVDADGVTHESLGDAVRSIALLSKDAWLAANFFSITADQNPEIAVRGYYLASNHTLVSYDPFSISNSIPVKQGDFLVANFTCNSGVRCIAYYDEETDKYSDSIQGSNTEKEFLYRATRDGNLRLCYMPQKPASYRVISSESLQQVITDVDSLKTDNERLLKLMDIMQYQADEQKEGEVGIAGKYVNLNLVIASYTGCYISKAIPVKRGDLVIARVWRNTACTQVAYCNEAANGDFSTAYNGSTADVAFISDRDGYICFSTNTNLTTRYQIYHADTVRNIYSLIAALEKGISEHEEIIEELNLQENLLVERSKNLFDKNTVIDGFYIGSELGAPVAQNASAISALIPVEAGKLYTVNRTVGNLSTSEIAYVTADGNTRLKPLNPDGTQRSNYIASRQITTMAPPEAAFCQFTVKFKGSSADYDKVQFEEGAEATDYAPYLYRPYFSHNLLPTDLNGFEEKVEAVERAAENVLNGVTRETITIANSGKIGFFSNSFLNGYTMRTHHALDNLGMWSDYIMYNYGRSGDDALETLARINANQAFFGAVPVQDWRLTYGVIAMQDNDGALFSADRETYRENFKKIAESIRAMGATPVLGTEHDAEENYYGLMALAEEEGYLFMDWGKTAASMGKFTPFWQNNHPATRTHWLWTYGMKSYLDTLPRPDKGIKLFRKRPDISDDLGGLMFNNVYERAERFMEIDNGYACLSQATEKYFDRLNNGMTNYEYIYDEYQKLQSGNEAVSFGTHSLVDVILPYTTGKLAALTMKLDAAGVEHAYIKRVLSLSNPLPDKRYIAFGVTEGKELLASGATFEISGGVGSATILGSYSVDQVVGDVVITTTSSVNKSTSVTDNPVCSISGVSFKGSYDYPSAEYMSRFDKPLGEWVEIALGAEGSTDLSAYLKTCIDFDKISVLLTGTNITLNSISFDVEGTVRKQTTGKKLPVYREGESLLTDSLLDSGTAWDNIDEVARYVPVISAVDNTTVEPLPNGISTVRILNEGESIKQAYDRSKLGKDAYHLDHIQIRVLARYFPEYIDSDEKWENSEIYEGSYDCAQLSILIDGKTKCGKTPVGAFWNEFLFDVQYQNCGKINTLTVKCDKKNLQVAKVEMVLVKD